MRFDVMPDTRAASKAPAPVGQAPPPRPERRLAELRTDPKHYLYALWNLCAKSGSQVPSPSFSFEPLLQGLPEGERTADTALLTVEEAYGELPKLDGHVSDTAGRRLVRQKKLDDDAPAPDLDAEVHVFLTSRRMLAWIYAYPPSGSGAELDADMVKKALRAAGVTCGIDEALLEALPNDPGRYFHLYPAARGVLPVHGLNGYVYDYYSRKPEMMLTENEWGCIDFTALEIFESAKQGDVLCAIYYPTDGIDGRTVLGQTVPGRRGKEPKIPKGRNTELSADGGCLLAVCEGHVDFNGRGFQINPVLEVRGDVDYSTGDLNCVGDIHVFGDIRTGFVIRATGNIQVDGVVESSVIEAGGDLVIRQGVQGNGEAVLRAHRSISAKFIESSNVYVHENLAAEHLINCEVYSSNDVTVRIGRGAIVGGHIHAGSLVTANIIGTRSEQKTGVFLGGEPLEEHERESIEKSIQALEGELEKVEQQPDGPAKARLTNKLWQQLLETRIKLEEYDAETSGGEKPPRTGRMVCDVVYPGVEIRINGVCRRITNETKMCTVSMEKDEIVLV